MVRCVVCAMMFLLATGKRELSSIDGEALRNVCVVQACRRSVNEYSLAIKDKTLMGRARYVC